MKILFIGDIMGRTGREALEQRLPALKDLYAPDITIVNGENAANGRGITSKICAEFYGWGVDVITTGNHVWDQREIIPYIAKDPKLLRPANYPEGTAGHGYVTVQTPSGHKVTVVNLMGRLFMDPLDDPFQVMEKILKEVRLGENVDAIFVDFHAETTSEKMSFGHNFAGRITAMVGTHTHVPTADAHVLEGGTAYQTDAGMTGDYNSVIGVEKDIAVKRFHKRGPGEHMRPATGEATLCGCVIEVDDNTGLAKSISPLRVGGVLAQAH